MATTTQARAILDQLSSAIVATGANQRRADQLLPADPRYPIDKQPRDGAHRRFELDLTGGRNSPHARFGDLKAAMVCDLVVRVAYARLGGTAGQGDRVGSGVNAVTDSMLIADDLCQEQHWLRATTGILEVTFVGSGRSVDGELSEVFDSRFTVEFETAWPL